nr:bHLH46 [Pinus massoniana]
MSIPSGFQAIFLSCNDGINMSVDVTEGVSRSSLLQSTEDPQSYNNHHAQSSNFISSCIFETPVDYQDHSDNPCLMSAFCNSGLAINGPYRDTVSQTAPTDKRWNHSLIEKQRRKEMKTLFSRLRALLPEENLRGKRAESDQVLGAVNYIRHLKQKIEDLSRKRDRMKSSLARKEEFPFVGIQSSSKQNFCRKHLRFQGSDGEIPSMKINFSHSSVEVSVNAFQDQIVYSHLLMVLEECGLEVVNATSSVINNAVFHTIHSKVTDVDYFNMDDLSDTLRHLISGNKAELRSLEARDEIHVEHAAQMRAKRFDQLTPRIKLN